MEELEEYYQLPWDNPEAKNVNSSCISESHLKKYSTTYKILHNQLKPIFSDDSETDDTENQGKTRSGGSGTPHSKIQARNKGQMNKKSNIHKKYIPCFSDESKLNYPKQSSLNAEQQAVYLQLMMKYAKKLPLDEKELKQHGLLHNKVVAERFEFAHFVRQRCESTQDRYRLINPDVKKYIEEVWQHRLSQVSRYPAHYQPLRLLSLVNADSKRPVVMEMKENLHEVGSSPVIILPKVNIPIHVPTDYSEVKKQLPPAALDVTRNAHSAPVSQDRLAESFATANAVDVVISSSSLKCIVDNHPPYYGKTWDLPVTVKEYRPCENKTMKIVYVDKALPAKCLTAMEKNAWFHKFGVKLLMCRTRRQQCFESEKNSSSINDYKFSSKKEGCKTEAVDDTGQRQKVDSVAAELTKEDVESCCSTDTPLEREHVDNACESSVSTDDENRLVIDCSDTDSGSDDKKCDCVRKGRKSVSRKLSENNNVCDSRATRSKARVLYGDQRVGDKSTRFSANEDCEMASTSLCKDASETMDGSGLEKSLGGFTVPSSFGAAESTLCSKVSDSVAVPQGDSTRNHSVNVSVNISTGNSQDCCASQQRSAEPSDGEQAKMKRKEFNLSDPGINVSYRLWKMCKDERRVKQLKKGFLEGECRNREINVLVRCKVDGHRIKDNKKHSFCVVPKMEYLPEYGSQCLTPSELTRQWISLYVRPGADLYRAHVNACTSEVMMIEQHSLQEVDQEAVQVGCPNSVMLGTLYNVLLGLVDLEAGSYLLSHTPKLGAYVNVLQSAGDGPFNLHDMYTVDTKATAVSDGSLWIPIDNNIVTPLHQANNRVPGMFPPTCFVRGKPLSKKYNKTNAKRKRNAK